MPNRTTEWFVAPDAKFGDGSQDKPFHDPWLALRSAGPGDVIHIAAGTYFGRYDRSSWIVDCPSLTILGGYNRDFSRRTPWQTPSVFAVFPGYEYAREDNLLSGRGDHSGLVLDGLFFDAAGRNTYGDKPGEGIRSYPSMDGAIASFNAENVTIRNCVFSNGATGAVELAGDGSRFENNLIINIIGTGMLNLRSAGGGSKKAITVVNNAFCFAHDMDSSCGTGADRAIGIRIECPAVVQDNIFISCSNAAIAIYRDLDRISVDRNLFYLTPRDIVNSRATGNTAEITEDNIDELEDVGLNSAAGNIVQDPGMTGLPPAWLDTYSRHLLANSIKQPLDAANAVRKASGLPALTPADLEKQEDKGDLAPRLAPLEVVALRFVAKQGCHPGELPVDFAATSARPIRTYQPIDWNVIDQPDSALANQRVELRAGLGFEQNSTLLADAPPTSHMGIRTYRPGTDDGSIYVLARRYTLPGRQFEDAIKYTNGREVESTYLLRGIYRNDLEPNSRQKVTLLVESIVPAPLLESQPATRPQGRDWFVKAGASGGDGTREKPFRDPFQALDKAEGGDAIHVAGGDYFGKLHSGKWKILVRNLTLLGGYSVEFSERDPWKHPTRLLLSAEEKAKGTPEGTILASEENSDGLVLDGFIFDGATYNSYAPDGSLDLRGSPTSPLVVLRGGRAAITVRNCLFLNASNAAISISCPFGVFENNVVLNTSGWSLKITADGPGPWIIRDNTVLFAADPASGAGTGRSSSDGTLLHLSGRAVATVSSNIFAFGDNLGVRATVAQQNVSFDNNVFAANLFSYLTDGQYLWTDSSTWERRAVADSAFASFKGNTLGLPKLPVDPPFADAALKRLFAIPSRISNEQWKAFAKQIGSPAVPEAPEGSAPTSAATTTQTLAASHSSPLSDSLASLDNVDANMKDQEAKNAAAAQPLYCPIFDWKKALHLAQEAEQGPGAHRRRLTVSFAPARARAEIQYAQITLQAVEADHASFDNKAVELEVTGARSSSTNPSFFPAGMTSDDYAAYSVSAIGDSIRTPIAILVRLDTAVSKLLDRTVPTDKLRIRGTARVPANPNALAVVVDSAETAQS